jgi:peroxiredoxin
MAATPSAMVELGTSAPDFRLPDVVTGRIVSRDDFGDAPALLVMFICNHCPYVRHVAEEIVRVGVDYQARGVGIVAISSNDIGQYPDDRPERMAEIAGMMGLTIPYLYDGTQDAAKAYAAACTPDFFLYDRDRRLAYRGQLDGARPANDVPVSGADLRTALDAVLDGRPVPAAQHPSVGCSIKWKPGNEPGAVLLGQARSGPEGSGPN